MYSSEWTWKLVKVLGAVCLAAVLLTVWDVVSIWLVSDEINEAVDAIIVPLGRLALFAVVFYLKGVKSCLKKAYRETPNRLPSKVLVRRFFKEEMLTNTERGMKIWIFVLANVAGALGKSWFTEVSVDWLGLNWVRNDWIGLFLTMVFACFVAKWIIQMATYIQNQTELERLMYIAPALPEEFQEETLENE